MTAPICVNASSAARAVNFGAHLHQQPCAACGRRSSPLALTTWWRFAQAPTLLDAAQRCPRRLICSEANRRSRRLADYLRGTSRPLDPRPGTETRRSVACSPCLQVQTDGVPRTISRISEWIPLCIRDGRQVGTSAPEGDIDDKYKLGCGCKHGNFPVKVNIRKRIRGKFLQGYRGLLTLLASQVAADAERPR